MRIKEIYRRLLVREDGAVRTKSKSSKWHFGSKTPAGLIVKIPDTKKLMLVHRLVAKAFIPEFTEEAIVKHVNGDKTDNRVENLVLAKKTYNREPRKPGLIGATLRPYRYSKPWMAQISVKGKKHFIGNFATEEEAHEAYMAYIREHGIT